MMGGYSCAKLLRTISAMVFIVLCFPALSSATGFSGTYIMTGQGVTLKLFLKQDPQGNLTGTLSSTTGISYQVEGMVEEGIGVGTCYNSQGGVYFEAEPHGNQLSFLIIEPDANNMPDYSRAKELVFVKEGPAMPGGRDRVLPQGRPGGKGSLGRIPQGPAIPEQGKPPEIGSNEAGDPSWGFKFTVPTGWKWKKDQNGIFLGHDSIAGLIWVFPHNQSNSQTLAQQMQQGLEDEGVFLSLAGQLQAISNNMLAGEYTGIVQGQQARGRGIGTLSPQGGGAYILAVTTPDKFGQQLANAADAIARGMHYFKVNVSDLVRHFAGRWASYSGGSGGGTLVNYTFYPDGTFSDESETSYSGEFSSDGWSTPDSSWGATGINRSRARWKVRGNKQAGQIIIIGQDGSENVINYRVFVERGRTYWREYLFNGRHFAKQD